MLQGLISAPLRRVFGLGAAATLLSLGATAAGASAGNAMCQGEDGEATEPEHLEMWLKRWTTQYKTEKPGFHMEAVNPNLIKYREQFITGEGPRNFFVPLCGKTLDLLWLAQFGFVGGVEISQDAIDQFAEANGLSWDKEAIEKSNKALFRATAPGSGNQLAIGKMDFFNLPDGWSDLGESQKHKFNFVWDRASLVAINPPMRQDYVKTIVEQCTPDAKVLLCTFDYAPGVREGPPHAVSEATVRELFEPFFVVDLLDRHTTPMPETEELVFLMKRKSE
ncbi:Thiopurine S-methyltransferase [Hondaea fermentalgiana]|uniref:thiopurine S-methyltransferase n=1 Tax=Hondaea fermentalgiana TaxID=2315210 RepID=A0A2R5G8A1_9STRA|nr:Thiopurine S-methyltransferase [Hondaea fermentalgiana]|eukprot:GBG24271.1 Thiopurine S-methyltransferase [Hondaea fermentalgiana]